MLDEFTKETGIKVNTVFIANGLEERIRTEGANSPADVILDGRYRPPAPPPRITASRSRDSEALDKAIPAAYRDPEGHWFGVSMRAPRRLRLEGPRKQDAMTYEELADPKWKGKVCIRSGQHLYNISLIAAMIAQHGRG